MVDWRLILEVAAQLESVNSSIGCEVALVVVDVDVT
jgi:hypothetical protein